MWLWFVSNIAGGLLGAATAAWFKDTKAGNWCYDRYLSISYWAVDKFGIDILDKEEISWKIKYPNVSKKIYDLERRIENLENNKLSTNKKD